MNTVNFWNAGVQPDILGSEGSFGNIEWTSQEIIDNLYEPLRNRHLDYITRHNIGTDTAGEYTMYAYEFTPASYTQTVYIQSGVHCLETEGYFGLARVMQLIAESDDERITALRNNTRFLVVPCVSVYGISKKGKYEHLMSANRYDNVFNVLNINPNRDFYEQRLDETKNIRKYIEQVDGQIDVAFDFHTTTSADWNAYLLVYPNGAPADFAQKLLDVTDELYRRNCTSVPKAFAGEEQNYPTGPLSGSYTGGLFERYGIPTATIEHSDYVFDDKIGTAVAMTRAVEMYMNHILCQTGY